MRVCLSMSHLYFSINFHIIISIIYLLLQSNISITMLIMISPPLRVKKIKLSFFTTDARSLSLSLSMLKIKLALIP